MIVDTLSQYVRECICFCGECVRIRDNVKKKNVKHTRTRHEDPHNHDEVKEP